MKKILIVAAHPDDEVLGCFGSVAKLIKQGYEAYTLILSKGKTSRGESQAGFEEEILDANKSIGIKEVILKDFPDNSFDSVPLLEIVKEIEEVKREITPQIIFTHFRNDLNIDHQITYKAVITATRPMQEESAKEIYSFEVLSSTEWNYPRSFSPNVFFDISENIEDKIKAMSFYKSELREFPHPRSLEGIKLNAKTQGMKVGVEFAEAFECVRIIK
ncbi:PIG-L deacetylase family protein [Caminibacter sp.]